MSDERWQITLFGNKKQCIYSGIKRLAKLNLVMDKSDKMFGQPVSNLTLILRNQILEGIIFEMREALKHYKDGDDRESGYMCRAEVLLKKYNKSWDEIYEDIDKQIEDLDKA